MFILVWHYQTAGFRYRTTAGITFCVDECHFIVCESYSLRVFYRSELTRTLSDNTIASSWAGLLDEESSYPFPVGLCNWDQVQEIAIRGRRGMYGELPKCLTELKSLSQLYVLIF